MTPLGAKQTPGPQGLSVSVETKTLSRQGLRLNTQESIKNDKKKRL